MVTALPPTNNKREVIESLIQLAEKEQRNGNKAVTLEKLANLRKYLTSGDNLPHQPVKNFNNLPPPPIPKFSPFYSKFAVSKSPAGEEKKKPARTKPHKPSAYKKFSFKRAEAIVIELLETTANILDNLHLFSKFPMFPKTLVRLLKQTNKLWVLILVFLIRKTISQLLNVLRKEKKVQVELEILNNNKTSAIVNEDINKKYQKVLKDLRFDKMMLYLELVGNFLDMTFNLIELYGLPVPDWFMSLLNFASMSMTIYRMNKDDEYVDDDITEDLI